MVMADGKGDCVRVGNSKWDGNGDGVAVVDCMLKGGDCEVSTSAKIADLATVAPAAKLYPRLLS